MEILKPLNAMDAFQLSKGMYAISLVLGRASGLPEPQFNNVITLTDHLIGFGSSLWMTVLSLYAIACSLVLVWKHNRFQAGVSLFSMWLWLFTGALTMLSPFSPSSGLYQLMLGSVSLWALYYRGRRHPDE